MNLATQHARVNAADAIHRYALEALDYDLAHVGRIVDLALHVLDNELARALLAGQREGDSSGSSSLHLRAPLRSES